MTLDHLTGSPLYVIGCPAWPVAGTEMDRINLWPFVAIGEGIGRLAALREGQQIGRFATPLNGAVTALQILLSPGTPPIYHPPVVKARFAAEQLLQVVGELLTLSKTKPATVITTNMIRHGDEAWSRFEAALQTELPSLHTYSVSQSLAWDTEILVEHAELLLPEDIRSKVPNDTIIDLREAGRAVAFDLHTAAGFHTVRATEAVIRDYYKAVLGVLPKLRDRNWGCYTRTLRTSPRSDAKVLGFIDHIREHYRNPITHPGERLIKKDSQVLLSVCTSAIIQIVEAMDALPPLPPAAAMV